MFARAEAGHLEVKIQEDDHRTYQSYCRIYNVQPYNSIDFEL